MVAAFSVTTQSFQKGFKMEHKDMLHATYRLKIAICYRNKRHLPFRDKCYCAYQLVIFFRLAGSKCSQYLRIQSGECVVFPYTGW
jgi:hypothetical protein